MASGQEDNRMPDTPDQEVTFRPDRPPAASTSKRDESEEESDDELIVNARIRNRDGSVERVRIKRTAELEEPRPAPEQATPSTSGWRGRPAPLRPQARVWAPPGEPVDVERATRPHMLPDRFDGKTPWVDYKSHFEACALINRWTDEQKKLFLSASLRGGAQSLLADGGHDSASFNELMERLERRYGPGEQAEIFLTQLRARTRKERETLPELGQSIRRLTAQAYPEMNREAQERLAIGFFTDAIPDSEIRAGIFRAHTKTLDEAVSAAIMAEAFLEGERYRTGQNKPPRPGRLMQINNDDYLAGQLAELKKCIEDIKAGQARANGNGPNRNRPPLICYRCGQEGHISRHCGQNSGNAPRPNPGAGNGSRPPMRPNHM